jgi:hypothetical protein
MRGYRRPSVSTTCRAVWRYVTSYTDSWTGGGWHDRGSKVTPSTSPPARRGKPILVGGSPAVIPRTAPPPTSLTLRDATQPGDQA